MLTHFPSPYPGEWWYSVLCRYHVRSGYAKQQTTVQELFGKDRVPLESVFPNGTLRQICSQLPSELFPIREMILQHTLFPFYMRCQSLAAKDEMLGRLCRGEISTITGIRKFAEKDSWRPRYCPHCATEEQQELGEPYWHVVHQIPLISHCPTHGCRLIPVEALPMAQLDYTFFPLSSFKLFPAPPPEGDVPEWQFTLSKILHDYQTLPHTASATEGHSNLAITLSNMGYASQQKASQHTLLNAKRLYWDMVDFFGEPLMTRMFGGEKGICIINRACKWAVATPERYALLQCFAGLDSSTMFSTARVEDRMEVRLQELQGTGVTYTKKQVQELLGVTASQLEITAQKYEIAPFWHRGGGEKEGQHKLSINLDDEEYLIYKTAKQASGYRFDGHFIKYCVLQYIQEHKEIVGKDAKNSEQKNPAEVL